jgi:hypothetical protein
VNLGITAPTAGGAVRGVVSIEGSVEIPDFASYKIEVYPTDAATQRRTVREGDRPVPSGLLAQWNTADARNANYTIVLIAFDKAGRSREIAITVRVAN